MVKIVETQTEEKQKNKKFKKALFISLIAIVLVLIITVTAILVIFLNKPKRNKNELNVFNYGLVAVLTDEGWGYADKSGKLVITPQFEEANPFTNNGLALVCLAGHYGFINTKGKYVISPIYQEAFSFVGDEDLAVVKRNSKYGYVDEDGDEEIACQFEEAHPFVNGLARVKISGKYGFIDDDGHFVINPTFKIARDFSSNGVAIVSQNTDKGVKSACINRRGELLTEYIYDYINVENNYAIAFDGIEYTVFNSKMKQLFKTENEIIGITSQLDRFKNIKEGLIPFRNKSYKFGYMNLKGEEVIAAEYDVLGNFYDGLAVVKKDGKYGFINKNNQIVIENKFEFAEDFSNGYAVIKQDNMYGLINTKGEIVLAAEYASLGKVNNGICYFAKADKSGYGYINVNGQVVVQQICSKIIGLNENVYSCSDDGYIVVKQDDFYGIIDKNGHYIVNPYLLDINFM